MSERAVSHEPVILRWAVESVEPEALQRASYALARSCTTETTREDDHWVVRLFARNGADPVITAHRFRQDVADQSLRISIARRTEPLRNAVFAMAFARLPEASDKSR